MSLDLLPALGLVLVMSLLAGVLDTAGFRLLLPDRGRPFPLLPLLAVHYASDAVLKTIPVGLPLAEAVRVRMLMRKIGVPAGQSIASVLSRRLYLGTAQGTFLLAGSLAGIPALGVLLEGWTGHPGWAWGIPAIGAAATAALGAMLLGTASGTTFQRMAGFFHRIPLRRTREWLSSRLAAFQAADLHLRALPSPRTVGFWKTGLCFLLVWCTEALETYLLLRVLGISDSFSAAIGLETLVSMLKLAAFFLPSGIIVQDTSYAGLMVAMGIAGSLEAAVPFVLLKRVKDLVYIGAGYLILAAHGIKPVRRLLRFESA